jgi:DNA-binding response OmpR family regulator
MSEIPPDAPPEGNPPADEKDGRRPPTILVVENEVLVRIPVCDYLRNCGFRVLEATHAGEAQALLDSGEQVAIVFSAIAMPGALNGFGLATWVRRRHPAVKVILTVGVREKAKMAAEFCEEEHELLDKPYGYEVLLARIHAMLGRGGAGGPA